MPDREGRCGPALAVLEPRFPKVAAQLRNAETDVLAYLHFPTDHWRSVSSTDEIVKPALAAA